MVPLPEWIDPDIWEAYLEMRKKIKKPATEYAKKLAIRKLENIWREHRHGPSDVLEQSILMCWQGLFPLMETRNNRKEEDWRRESRIGQGPVVPRNQ